MSKIQIMAICGSLLFLFIIFESIRRKKLKESYALIWLLIGFVFLFFAIFKGFVDKFASWFGIYYSPAVLFLLLITAGFALLFHFSLVISKQKEMLKNLTQEVALLKSELEELRRQK